MLGGNLLVLNIRFAVVDEPSVYLVKNPYANLLVGFYNYGAP